MALLAARAAKGPGKKGGKKAKAAAEPANQRRKRRPRTAKPRTAKASPSARRSRKPPRTDASRRSRAYRSTARRSGPVRRPTRPTPPSEATEFLRRRCIACATRPQKKSWASEQRHPVVERRQHARRSRAPRRGSGFPACCGERARRVLPIPSSPASRPGCRRASVDPPPKWRRQPRSATKTNVSAIDQIEVCQFRRHGVSPSRSSNMFRPSMRGRVNYRVLIDR